MDIITETLCAGCKVNFNLLITAVRPDGWHELDSFFYPLDEPHDELALTPTARPGLRVVCDVPGIDLENNTLTKAYAAFAESAGFAPGLSLELRKGIPHGMGLGGGSADAAALLLWLNRKAPRPLSLDALESLALGVGADVLFFLHNRPCRATGFGEIMEPEALRLSCTLVLICPDVRVSTPWAYKAYDAGRKDGNSGDKRMFLTGSGARAIRRASIGAGMPRHRLMINDFEPVVFEAYPLVRRCKERLLQNGAACAVMSGSGAAVFGLFADKNTAERARREAAKDAIIGAYVHEPA